MTSDALYALRGHSWCPLVNTPTQIYMYLSAHEELLYVVPLAGGLAQLVGGGVSLLVGIGVLPLELHQGDLQPLHHLTNERHLL